MKQLKPLTPESLAEGLTHLCAVDPDLAQIYARLGAPPMWAREPGSPRWFISFWNSRSRWLRPVRRLQSWRRRREPSARGGFFNLTMSSSRGLALAAKKRDIAKGWRNPF